MTSLNSFLTNVYFITMYIASEVSKHELIAVSTCQALDLMKE